MVTVQKRMRSPPRGPGKITRVCCLLGRRWKNELDPSMCTDGVCAVGAWPATDDQALCSRSQHVFDIGVRSASTISLGGRSSTYPRTADRHPSSFDTDVLGWYPGHGGPCRRWVCGNADYDLCRYTILWDAFAARPHDEGCIAGSMDNLGPGMGESSHDNLSFCR